MPADQAPGQDQAQQPQFTIEKIYLKDMSLEVPNSPQVFLERDAPKVDIQLGTRAIPLEEGHYDTMGSARRRRSHEGNPSACLVPAHHLAEARLEWPSPLP